MQTQHGLSIIAGSQPGLSLRELLGITLRITAAFLVIVGILGLGLLVYRFADLPGAVAYSLITSFVLLPRSPLGKIVGFLVGVGISCLVVAAMIAGPSGFVVALSSMALSLLIGFLVFNRLPFYHIVPRGTAVAVRDNGRLLVRTQGRYRQIPFLREVEIITEPISIAELTYKSEPQELLTKSLETVHLQIIANFRLMREETTGDLIPRAVIDAKFNVPDWNESTKEAIITILNEQFGKLNLRTQVLEHWKDIREQLQQEISRETKKWGVEITKVGFRNIKLQTDAIESLVSEEKAMQKGELERIRAEALRDIVSNLREAGLSAGDIITLQYIEALKELARSPANKIILPYETGEALKRLNTIIGDELGSENPSKDQKNQPAVK